MCQASFAALCVVSGLSEKVTDVPAEIAPLLKTYRKEIRKAKIKADEALAKRAKGSKDDLMDGEAAAFKRATQEWWCEIPKVSVSMAFHLAPQSRLASNAEYQHLGEIPELIFGAILLDSDYDLALVRSIFQTHFLPFFESYCVGVHEGVVHPKAALLQLLYQRACQAYTFEKGAFSENVKGEYEAKSEWQSLYLIGGDSRNSADDQSFFTTRLQVEDIRSVKMWLFAKRAMRCCKR